MPSYPGPVKRFWEILRCTNMDPLDLDPFVDDGLFGKKYCNAWLENYL